MCVVFFGSSFCLCPWNMSGALMKRGKLDRERDSEHCVKTITRPEVMECQRCPEVHRSQRHGTVFPPSSQGKTVSLTPHRGLPSPWQLDNQFLLLKPSSVWSFIKTSGNQHRRAGHFLYPTVPLTPGPWFGINGELAHGMHLLAGYSERARTYVVWPLKASALKPNLSLWSWFRTVLLNVIITSSHPFP